MYLSLLKNGWIKVSCLQVRTRGKKISLWLEKKDLKLAVQPRKLNYGPGLTFVTFYEQVI